MSDKRQQWILAFLWLDLSVSLLWLGYAVCQNGNILWNPSLLRLHLLGHQTLNQRYRLWHLHRLLHNNRKAPR